MPLDELVGAPTVGDPRVHLTPRVRNGRTVIPLTGKPGALQAWKTVIPAAQNVPDLCTHEGYEWLYVLSGRMRLIVAEHDLIMEPGEAAEFDTRLPHWFGAAAWASRRDPEPVRPPGRAHARPRRSPHPPPPPRPRLGGRRLNRTRVQPIGFPGESSQTRCPRASR